MFLWAPLARKAKNARFSRVLLYFLTIQFVLFIPTAYMLIKTEPFAMYARLHGIDFTYFDSFSTELISVGENADGYIHLIKIKKEETYTAIISNPVAETDETEETENIPDRVYSLHISPWREELLEEETDADYLIGITPEYVYYRDADAVLAIPASAVPAWVIRDWDVYELFNYLALHNRYVPSVLLPLVLMIFAAFFLGQIVFYWAVSWLYGQTRRVTTYMTFKERFIVCVYASVPALLPGLLVGLIMPVFNIFIFELVIIYVVYKILGEY